MVTEFSEFSESSESLPGVLEVSGLEFRYSAHGSLVLRGVDLSVGAGERVAVMGPSGSGKSTLLLCAAGLLRAGAGRVLLDGVDVVSASERMLTAMRRDRVAFIFQDLNLVESLTAAQNVALPGLMGGRMRSPGDVTGVLERVGLAGLEDRLPSRLSGGGSGSGWRWPGPWCRVRRWCSPTSRRGRWTCGRALRCWGSLTCCPMPAAGCWWSLTTLAWPRGPTGWCGWWTGARRVGSPGRVPPRLPGTWPTSRPGSRHSPGAEGETRP